MRNETVAGRYASAVFSLASDAGRLAAVGDSLHAARTALEGNDDARRFFVSPVVAREVKNEFLSRAFEGKVDEIVMKLLLLLVHKRRENLLGAISTVYDQLALEAEGKEPLEVRSARPLDGPELDALVARLSRNQRKAFEVTARVEPALLGGVRITMGGRRVDGTVAGRLDELARELFTEN